MKKLLSLIALFSVIAIGAAVSVSSANAATLTSAVHALKAEQTGVVEKAYYRRYHHPLLSPRLPSSPLLSRLLSPWLLRLRLPSPLLVAQWLSPLPSVVLRLQNSKASGLNSGAY